MAVRIRSRFFGSENALAVSVLANMGVIGLLNNRQDAGWNDHAIPDRIDTVHWLLDVTAWRRNRSFILGIFFPHPAGTNRSPAVIQLHVSQSTAPFFLIISFIALII